ncbi:hypothetical protein GCM10011399_33960 [Subtercola lobariae]|uniref:Uncharacterized protein n=1 Tax=Subtercola lobariae TaxID=1588641 RepID=A0A917BES8_9MICO|nr:hypothetical protein GCM10011399_33960 [Subtercola lobariae]
MPTTHDHGHVLAIIDAVSSFGGEPYARIYRDKLGGDTTTIVSLRFSSYRAKIGPLPPKIAARLRPAVFWNGLRNRAINVPARIDTNPDSPHYLGVWLNTTLKENVTTN